MASRFDVSGFSGGFEKGRDFVERRALAERAAANQQQLQSLRERKFELDKQRGGQAQKERSFKIGEALFGSIKTQIDAIANSKDTTPEAKARAFEAMAPLLENRQELINSSGFGGDLNNLLAIAKETAFDPKAIALSNIGAQTQPEVLEGERAAKAAVTPPALRETRVEGAPPGTVQTQRIDQFTGEATPVEGTQGLKVSAQVPSLGALTGETAKDVRKIRDAIRANTATLTEIDETIKAFKDAPEAAGIVGATIENVGGLVEQIPVIGEDIAKAAGLDTDKVTDARTQAAATLARLLPSITGEKGGRYTDTERAIAENIQKTLKPTASAKQVSTALNKIREIEDRSRNREFARLLTTSGADLTTDDGIDAFGDVLIKNQFTEDQAAKIIADMRKRMGLTGG